MEEKNRFVDFHVCRYTLCMVIIANVNSRELKMLSVIGKYKHIGQVYKLFVLLCVMRVK